jgi:hypothetical protein
MDLLRAAACVLCLAFAARGDVFSPGPLARGHQQLEGLSNCTQCHVQGARLEETRCLDCHKELKESLAAKKGFHGRLTDQRCNLCHHEHGGRDFALIDWGAGGEKGFDHRQAGWVLEGKHARISCEACHVPRLASDPKVRELLATHPGRETFLGLSRACASCHFDEHREQLGRDCASCHSQTAWKPAPRFDHARTNFALRGKHAAVECLACHARTLDAEAHANAPVPPKSESFLRFRPVAHQGCADCHRDPHDGRLGADCKGCHSESGWGTVRSAGPGRAFHDQTRYPLRGAHATVACKSCHGPFPGVRAVFKGLRFDTCTACHADAHLGQLAESCDGCHSLQGFVPARYDLARHKAFPLEGGHAAVACADCHRESRALESKAAPLRAWLAKRGRPPEVSLVQFHPPAPAGRCDTCHVDAHRGQFAAKVAKAGCADCHRVSSFRDVAFDHARDTRFALAGAHARTACAACHAADAAGTVRYKPLAVACASCHADPHAGQLAVTRGVSDCSSCHGSERWTELRFVHGPPFTAFELTGRHAQLDCVACHRQVAAPGARVRQYAGLPRTCEGCHSDPHHGAFEGAFP